MSHTTIDERIQQLRILMQQRKIDIYIVPTSDYHTSEYVGDYFKERAFITGFTGSAGCAVITEDEAGLWTDGRYFIQAARQLQGTQVKLFPMGEEGVPTVLEYVKEKLPEHGCIGFDGRCMNVTAAKGYEKIAREVSGRLYTSEDLIDIIWEERPQLPAQPIWILPMEYAGESAEDKIRRIREKMKQEHADGHLINCLYDIAWILNLRGNDISHVPVFLSYLWISFTEVILYVDERCLSQKVTDYLTECTVKMRPYAAIYQELPTLSGHHILLDEHIINEQLFEHLPKDVEVISKPNPSELMRSVKNPVEIANTKKAHIRDGVAFTRFLYYVKHKMAQAAADNSQEERLDEWSASEYLLECRASQEHFIDVSFDTICAYGANGAMMHYSATPEQYSVLEPTGFLLVDSGGHYLEGTTDITRTIALGTLTREMVEYYTTVLRCNLRLAAAKFPVGCCGQNLDVLARGPVWDMGLDYRCGTGHGVGHILNVHEGPNAFRWRIPKDGDTTPIEPGMITTDEPGLYIEGAFGIRLENELLCVLDEKTEYGQFLSFEPLTFAPFDLDAIDKNLLSDRERQQLNAYHSSVYEKISPYLPLEEKAWLKEITKPI